MNKDRAFVLPQREQGFTLEDLHLVLGVLCHPTIAGYKMLLCADRCVPPSPWTDKFRIEVDHKHKVVRLSGDFT